MKRSVAGALVALLAGCTGITDGACTLLACENGLAVELASAPDGAYTVEVFTAASQNGPHYIFQCVDPATCGTSAFFAEFTPVNVVVRVTTGGRTHEETVTPAYQQVRPNGPNCGPECKQATVTVALP